MRIRKVVWDPDFVENAGRYLDLEMDRDELKSRIDEIKREAPTKEERLRTLIDRMEFIDHLAVLKDNAYKMDFEIDGQEVKGVDFDIDALRKYLALTCVDIFSRHQHFDQWLLNNCHDHEDNEPVDDFIKRKHQEYIDELGTTSSFIRAFTQAPKHVVDEFENNLAVVFKGSETRNVSDIARYLSKIRNKYTHEGRRFHLDPSVPFVQEQVLGPRDENELRVEPGFDLTKAILEVAKARARQILDLH